MSHGAVPKLHKRPDTAPTATALAHTKLTWKLDQANTIFCLFTTLLSRGAYLCITSLSAPLLFQLLQSTWLNSNVLLFLSPERQCFFPLAEESVQLLTTHRTNLLLLEPTRPRGSRHISAYLKFGSGESCDFLYVSGYNSSFSEDQSKDEFNSLYHYVLTFIK